MNTINIDLAKQIAEIVIDKSYWNNEWFIFFTILFIGLIAGICAWISSYLTTKAQNMALREDFDKLLEQIELQTKTVKQIEEDIEHNYWHKRETIKIKMEKIEEAYDSLNKEIEEIRISIAKAMVDKQEDATNLSGKFQIIISLYFKEMKNELEQYINVRNKCITFIAKAYKDNADLNDQQSAIAYNMEKKGEVDELMNEIGIVKSKNEFALQKKMEQLTI